MISRSHSHCNYGARRFVLTLTSVVAARELTSGKYVAFYSIGNYVSDECWSGWRRKPLSAATQPLLLHNNTRTIGEAFTLIWLISGRNDITYVDSLLRYHSFLMSNAGVLSNDRLMQRFCGFKCPQRWSVKFSRCVGLEHAGILSKRKNERRWSGLHCW